MVTSPEFKLNPSAMKFIGEHGKALAQKIEDITGGAIPKGIIAVNKGDQVDLLFKAQDSVLYCPNAHFREIGKGDVGLAFDRPKVYGPDSPEAKEYSRVAKAVYKD